VRVVGVLVPGGQRVGVGVVEQAVVAVAPRERLGAQPEVLVGPELGRVVVLVRQVGVGHAQTDGRQRNDERQLLPHAHRGIMILRSLGTQAPDRALKIS